MFVPRLRVSAACLVTVAISSLADPAAAGASGVVQRSSTIPRRGHSRARSATGPCSGEAQNSGEFVGGGAGNYALGANSGIVAGQSNSVCDQLSGIGTGEGNEIYNDGVNGAEDSFIAAGNDNYISSYRSFIGAGYGNTGRGTHDFIGAGYINLISANHGFIGSGDFNTVGGSGGFVGGGDYEFFTIQGEGFKAFGNSADGIDSFVGGGDLNNVSGNGSFIGGGGFNDAALSGLSPGNQVSGADSFIGSGDQNVVIGDQTFLGGGNQNLTKGYQTFLGGGNQNVANGSQTFLGSGSNNVATGNQAVLGGGYGNTIGSSASYSVIGGGYGNTMNAQKASLGGGEQNNVTGSFATIPGGYRNEALGNESFAAGSQAEAKYTGSFVWSDYVAGEKAQVDSRPGEFVARASGGVYFFSNAASSAGVYLAAGSGTWSSLSDRNAKTGLVPLDDASILSKVASLPISAWQYTSERGVRHVGPMAQDFYAAFGVGEDDRHITSIDEDGIALAAIKALDAKLAAENSENARLQTRLAKLEEKVGRIIEAR